MLEEGEGEGWMRGGQGVGERWAYYLFQYIYFPRKRFYIENH
jgi:hypothetical protein